MTTSLTGGEKWIVAGLRTAFAKNDGPFQAKDAIELSLPIVREMVARGGRPDFFVWGTVIPSLGWSNIAREVLLDAGVDPTIPAFSTVMACSTSMAAAIEALSMLDGRSRHLALVGGSESMSQVSIGLNIRLAVWLRQLLQARSTNDRLKKLSQLRLKDIRLHIPSIANRSTGKSMGEHTEEMAKSWNIAREDQDQNALDSHQRASAAWAKGFFDDLVLPLPELARDTIPRPNTSLAKLAKLPPVYDRTSGKGTLTAGNSSPLTDGAAGLWVATSEGLSRLPNSLPRVRVVDWELGAIDLKTEGLLMAPAYSIPRLLLRQGLRYDDIHLWEIHEAFSAQVLCHIKALESREFLREKVGIDFDFGSFPRERMNPNGGSVAIGHPFAATGARILSQSIKELAVMPRGSRAIVSICADGGVGSVMLLEACS
jgi:acetyl-CoA C-acetyltransferase